MGRDNKFRQRASDDAVGAFINGEIEDAVAAKIIKNLGNSRVQVYYLNEKKSGVEGIALIRALLRRKGQVPIGTNDIIVMTPRTFESEIGKKHFDLIGIARGKQISDMRKKNLIPDYFANDAVSDSFTKKEDAAIEFDYGGDEVDVDAI